jgi:hypothetical protein
MRARGRAWKADEMGEGRKIGIGSRLCSANGFGSYDRRDGETRTASCTSWIMQSRINRSCTISHTSSVTSPSESVSSQKKGSFSFATTYIEKQMILLSQSDAHLRNDVERERVSLSAYSIRTCLQTSNPPRHPRGSHQIHFRLLSLAYKINHAAL